MLEWFKAHTALMWSAFGVSLIVFLVGLLVVPALILRIPADYFAHENRPPDRWSGSHRAVRIAVMVGKNVLGAILLIAGLVMMAGPGQGLLTLFVSFMLFDFPGKYRLEKRILRWRHVHRPINWFRKRRGRPPLRIREEAASSPTPVEP